MATVTQKASSRYLKSVPKFQRILKSAKDRDINEADTVLIIQDMLAEVFGFDKYVEITSEFAIRNTYVDLGIKIGEKIQFLIEVKAIGLALNESHLRQVIDYGANHGSPWVILSNGIHWELHRIRFEKPISHNLVAEFNFLELNPRKKADQEKLFLLSKGGLSKSVRENYYERVQNINRFVLAAILLSDSTLKSIKRDLRKLAPGIKIDTTEIEAILRNDVLKRDVIEGTEAKKAAGRTRRLARKAKKTTKSVRTLPNTNEE